MSDLITPTGHLVYHGDPLTDEWFAARRDGITGTDLPKIIGTSKYGNALSVWRDKRGEAADDDAREAAHWGHVLEEPVAAEWARRYDTEVAPVGIIANRAEPWMRASLDRLVDLCPDQALQPFGCGLEIKTRSAYKAGDFADDIPDDVLAQTQWGLMVTGLAHMHVAVLIGGQRLKAFRVDRDDDVEAYLLDAARPVWEAVETGRPPTVHPDADGILLRELNDMYSSRQGVREIPAGPGRKWLDLYRTGGALEGDGKAFKAKAKAGLVQLLDDGDTATVDGEPVFTYKPGKASDEVTAENLRRLQTTLPTFYAWFKKRGFITTKTPGPTFRLVKTTTTEETQ